MLQRTRSRGTQRGWKLPAIGSCLTLVHVQCRSDRGAAAAEVAAKAKGKRRPAGPKSEQGPGSVNFARSGAVFGLLESRKSVHANVANAVPTPQQASNTPTAAALRL